MGDTFIRGLRCEFADSRISSKTGAVRMRFLSLYVLYLLVFGTLLLSGCIGLTGTKGQGTPPTAAAISMSPPSVSFGPVAVGSTVSQSVTVSNTGGSNLSITQASVGAQGFAVSGVSFPMILGAGQQSTFRVVFAPRAIGSVSGAISVMSNAASAPATVSVSGSGVAATSLLNASTANLNLGNVPIGNSNVLGVTLTNAGNSNVSISNVRVSGAGFTTSGVSAGLILTPGQSATLNVTFIPIAVGGSTGSVTVTSNAANSPAIISVSGSGTQEVPHSVALSWTAGAPLVTVPLVTGYNVYRSTVSGGPYTKLNSVADAAAAYTDSSVQAGQIYYYVVTSVALGALESVYSNEASATVPTP
jgi:hypothetical protein